MKSNNKTYIPSNPRKYFLTAIAVQNDAFQEEYAEKKLEQSCTALIECGYCSGCRSCEVCALQLAHENTMNLLKVPEIREERYQNWKKKQVINNAHTHNKYGTRVLHCN